MIALLVCVAIFAAVGFLAPHKPDPAKNSPYECGFDQASPIATQLPVHYYRVAILFVLFDLEIVFLMPWAVSLTKMNLTGFVVGIAFTGILGLGLLYEWKKGALRWE